MGLYKRGDIYWYRFVWNGELIRESTRQTNKRVAQQMEAAHRASLAKGEVGIRDKKREVTLGEFIKCDVKPYVESRFADKPKTLEYYRAGLKLLGAYTSRCRHARSVRSPLTRLLDTLPDCATLSTPWPRSTAGLRSCAAF